MNVVEMDVYYIIISTIVFEADAVSVKVSDPGTPPS